MGINRQEQNQTMNVRCAINDDINNDNDDDSCTNTFASSGPLASSAIDGAMHVSHE